MTCREEILEVIHQLMRETGQPTFTPTQVIERMLARGTLHKELTIRAYVTYGMCAAEGEAGRRRFSDLERVGRGQYRVRQRELNASR